MSIEHVAMSLGQTQTQTDLIRHLSLSTYAETKLGAHTHAGLPEG